MNIRMIHNGRDRDSLLMPMDERTVDLMLQYSIQLIRCEPTTRIIPDSSDGHFRSAFSAGPSSRPGFASTSRTVTRPDGWPAVMDRIDNA
jgi:hypothetical protein